MVDRRRRRSDKKKVVAALLCFFVGFLGVHRFYVGKVFTGILMLFLSYVCKLFFEQYNTLGTDENLQVLLFYFLPLLIWVIIDFVRIITGSFGDKENRGLS